MSIADNLAFLNRLPKMSDFAPTGVSHDVLQEIADFGANPGNLRMKCFVPTDLPPNSPLVVVLHGCTQTAASYDYGSGWSALAARHGFALLMPEQQRSNNPNLCFNWFSPDDATRGSGEALSIHRMIAAMVRLHHVSARRIYITGLSAGGAMAAAMLAAYPDVFSAGAIIAGLPYGVASNMREALQAMASPQPHSARQLGDLVRGASPHRGPWPRVSVWHGDHDRVVDPANSAALVAQWLDVRGLGPTPMADGIVDGHRHRVWWDDTGMNIIESYTVAGMAHGVPLDIAGIEEPTGAAGPFMLDAGIDSTNHIAQFFGLTKVIRPKQNTSPGTQPRKRPASPIGRKPESVGAVIARALNAAGLIK